MDYNAPERSLVTRIKTVFSLLLILPSITAARCPEPNPSWVIDDDRIHANVSIDARPLEHAKVQLSSPTAHYSAVTDKEGAFLIPKVAVGSYSFVIKGWGEAHLQVRGWHRGAINRPVLSFNSDKGCLLLIQISN